MKVKNYLLNYDNLYIYQDTNMFKFSIDSVLLPNFVTINKTTKMILDIGTGNAPIPLILSTKTKAQIVGVEIQKKAYMLALESVKVNKLSDQITIINDDINSFYKNEDTEKYDIIVCNPPFFKDDTIKSSNRFKMLARQEHSLNMKQLLKISRKLLKNNGIISIVHRPSRLVEVLELMRANNIEPKRIRFVYPNEKKEANILLVEGRKNGNPGLKVDSPLYIYDLSGNYTEEVKSYFE